MHFLEGVIMANFTDPKRIQTLDLSHNPGSSRRRFQPRSSNAATTARRSSLSVPVSGQPSVDVGHRKDAKRIGAMDPSR
jgi:hypothetical protein